MHSTEYIYYWISYLLHRTFNPCIDTFVCFAIDSVFNQQVLYAYQFLSRTIDKETLDDVYFLLMSMWVQIIRVRGDIIKKNR